MVKDGHFSFQTQLPKLKSNSLQEKNDYFLNIFLASRFSFRLSQIFQVHDMTINFFLKKNILTICLLRAPMPTIDGLSSLIISSHVRIVLKGWPFGPKLFISFLSKERVMAQKCFWGMGNFWSTCLKALVRMISVYHDLGILFCSLKIFGRFETVASLDAYQIISFFQKLIIFCCLIFEEFEK